MNTLLAPTETSLVIKSDGNHWLGPYSLLVRTLIDDLLVDGHFGAAATLENGAVVSGQVNALHQDLIWFDSGETVAVRDTVEFALF